MATEWSESIAIAQLEDEPALSEELQTLIERVSTDTGTVPDVVLNFADVTYVSSSNIAQLLKLREAVEAADRRMRLCSVSGEVSNVFVITGLDHFFQFSPDPMTALAGLQLDES